MLIPPPNWLPLLAGAGGVDPKLDEDTQWVSLFSIAGLGLGSSRPTASPTSAKTTISHQPRTSALR